MVEQQSTLKDLLLKEMATAEEKTFLKELVGFCLERPCGSVAITAGPERPEQVEWPLPQGAKWPLPKDEWWQAGRTEQSTAQYSQAPIL